jgi:regulator of chromosome condensation
MKRLNNATKRARSATTPSSARAKTKIVKFSKTAPTTRLRVLLFGSGESGELGLGAAEINGRGPEHAELPRYNHLLSPETVGVVQVAVGGMHCAVLTHDGQVLTWGVNDSKALGRDTKWEAPDELPDDMTDLNPLESTPAPVKGLDSLDSPVVQVVACDGATFVLTAAGNVYGWGTFYGNDGPFGFLKERIEGGRKGAYLFQDEPIRISQLKDIKELAAGTNHVLALTDSGNVYAWGSGHQAELGRRIMARREGEALVPRPVGLPKNKITKIFAGFNHSFAIDNQGQVWSWGLNNFGQTGLASNDDNLHISSPVVVDELRKYRIRQVGAGFHHTLACTEDGEVLAWGRCDDAQIGIDTSSIPAEHMLFDSRNQARILSVPTKVPGTANSFFFFFPPFVHINTNCFSGLSAQSVAAGIDNSFIINQEGSVLSWGFSDNYRTGLRTEDSVDKPTLVKSKAMAGMKFTFVGCGGQFSVIAGPPASEDAVPN